MLEIVLKLVMETDSELGALSKLNEIFTGYQAKDVTKDIEVLNIDRVQEVKEQIKIELPNLSSLETIKGGENEI